MAKHRRRGAILTLLLAVIGGPFEFVGRVFRALGGLIASVASEPLRANLVVDAIGLVALVVLVSTSALRDILNTVGHNQDAGVHPVWLFTILVFGGFGCVALVAYLQRPSGH